MGRKKATPDAQAEGQAYERHKETARARQAELSLSGRDIGTLPAVADPARKAAAEFCFRTFCEGYFPQTFSLAWSPDHLKVIRRIEDAVLRGGLFALAMPRGSGKSSLCQCACIWAVMYGHRSFVVLIGAEETSAEQMLDEIRTDLETNDLLEADFPEVVYPIQRLEGIANRCTGQLFQGERTRIKWKGKEIILPTIAGSKASGSILRVAGITGRIRGMKHKLANGLPIRPDLVVIDDPQTDTSARSRTQCEERERILSKAILGLAGPKKKIAGVMPCTVVEPGDMADNILDRTKHPDWCGERMKTVYAWPDRQDLWDRYAELRAEGLRADDEGAAATEFYRQHQAEMDAGSQVAWPERFNDDEISAIQNAWNWRLRDEAAFFAEGQNEPKRTTSDDEAKMLTADEIADKLNRLASGAVPVSVRTITAFIDVQQAALFWSVLAWEENCTGYVLAYGVYPDQERAYFTLRDVQRSLADLHPGGLEAAIYAGLEALTAKLLGQVWTRDDGTEMRVEKCPIDANWGASTDVVYRFCRQSAYPQVVIPAHGKYVGASSLPMSDYAKKPGDRVGLNWRIPALAGGRQVRHLTYDTNVWKSFVHARLAVPMGAPGCLSLWGDKAARHRLFAQHLTAEYRVRVQGRGREVDEWKLRTEKPDNHWLDCCAGAAVAASIQGCTLAGHEPATKKKERVSFAEMQRRKRGGR